MSDSKKTKKGGNLKKWLLLAFAILAAIGFGISRGPLYGAAAFVVVAGLGGYAWYLKSNLEPDTKDVLQVFAGIILFVIGYMSKGTLPYQTQIALINGYWLLLIISAHYEKDNPLEVAWYAGWMAVSNIVAAKLGFVIQDQFGLALVDMTKTVTVWFVPPAMAPLVYNLLIEPIVTRYLRERRKRVKSGLSWHKPITAEIKKATIEIPKTAVVAAKVRTMEMAAAKLPKREKKPKTGSRFKMPSFGRNKQDKSDDARQPAGQRPAQSTERERRPQTPIIQIASARSRLTVFVLRMEIGNKIVNRNLRGENN